MAHRMIKSMVPDRAFRSHWGVIAALIGYVALVGYAVFAQPEYRSPIAQPGNAVEANADRESDGNQRPPYPVVTLKALRATEDAGAADCGTSEECRAKQRDYSDLQAQWESAKSANGQLRFARWQTLIAGLGTVLVAIALIYTAKATTASIEANRISREAYIADQRPWVSHVKVRHSPIGTSPQNITAGAFKFFWTNSGKIPAINCNIWLELRIENSCDIVDDIHFEKTLSLPNKTSTMGPGIEAESIERVITVDEVIDIAEGRKRAFMWGLVEYGSLSSRTDQFYTEVCLEIRYRGDGRMLRDPTFKVWALICPAFGSQNTCT